MRGLVPLQDARQSPADAHDSAGCPAQPVRRRRALDGDGRIHHRPGSADASLTCHRWYRDRTAGRARTPRRTRPARLRARPRLGDQCVHLVQGRGQVEKHRGCLHRGDADRGHTSPGTVATPSCQPVPIANGAAYQAKTLRCSRQGGRAAARNAGLAQTAPTILAGQRSDSARPAQAPGAMGGPPCHRGRG